MDKIRSIDLVGVVHEQGFDIGQQFGAADTPDAEVHCLALDVVAVFGRAGQLVIVDLTAHAAGNHHRGTEMVPHLVRQPDKFFIRLHREAAALAAGAPELLPGEILDFIPEGARLSKILYIYIILYISKIEVESKTRYI